MFQAIGMGLGALLSDGGRNKGQGPHSGGVIGDLSYIGLKQKGYLSG